MKKLLLSAAIVVASSNANANNLCQSAGDLAADVIAYAYKGGAVVQILDGVTDRISRTIIYGAYEYKRNDAVGDVKLDQQEYRKRVVEKCLQDGYKKS